MIYNDHEITYYFEHHLLLAPTKRHGNFYNLLPSIFIKNVKN